MNETYAVTVPGPTPTSRKESYPALRDEAIRLSLVGQILRRWRRLFAVLAVLGAGLGALAWVALPTTFESTSTILLQGPRSESQVRTEAQIAMSRVVLHRAATTLGWQVTDLSEDAVTAGVGDGSVIKITARAPTRAAARAFARQATKAYMSFSTQIANRAANAIANALSERRREVQRRIEKLNEAINGPAGSSGTAGVESRATGATDLGTLRATRKELKQELTDIEGRIVQAKANAAVGRTNMRVIEAADDPAGPATPSLLQLIAGGVVLAPLFGTAALVTSRLADQRLRRRSDIASALGAPVLGTVQAAPEWLAAPSEAGGLWARARRILEREPSWGSYDPSLDDPRYRRILERLRAAPGRALQLLVVVIDDDPTAAGAAARLTAVASEITEPRPVVSDRAQFATAVPSGTTRDHPVETLGRFGPSRAPETVLRVHATPAARPTVPYFPDVSGALVVVTAGTRTPRELLAIAEGCQDAALPVWGALVIVPPAIDDEVERGPGLSAPEHQVADAGPLNGHASRIRL